MDWFLFKFVELIMKSQWYNIYIQKQHQEVHFYLLKVKNLHFSKFMKMSLINYGNQVMKFKLLEELIIIKQVAHRRITYRSTSHTTIHTGLALHTAAPYPSPMMLFSPPPQVINYFEINLLLVCARVPQLTNSSSHHARL